MKIKIFIVHFSRSKNKQIKSNKTLRSYSSFSKKINIKCQLRVMQKKHSTKTTSPPLLNTTSSFAPPSSSSLLQTVSHFLLPTIRTTSTQTTITAWFRRPLHNIQSRPRTRWTPQTYTLQSFVVVGCSFECWQLSVILLMTRGRCGWWRWVMIVVVITSVIRCATAGSTLIC